MKNCIDILIKTLS